MAPAGWMVPALMDGDEDQMRRLIENYERCLESIVKESLSNVAVAAGICPG